MDERQDPSPAQIRAARGLLGWTQSQLSARSGVSEQTIRLCETGQRQPYGRTLDSLQSALLEAGIVFIDDNGDKGVMLRSR